MRRYYLLTDYAIPLYVKNVYSYTIYDANIKPEIKSDVYFNKVPDTKNIMICKLNSSTNVRVAFFDFPTGFYLIKAPNRFDGYKIAYIIRGYHTLNGCSPLPCEERSIFFLLELTNIPNPQWTKEQFLNTIYKHQDDSNEIINTLSMTIRVKGYEFDELSKFIKVFYNNDDLWRSLECYIESNHLFYGWMVDSFYHCHYYPNRLMQPRWILEKSMYENKIRYESAFLAAFKGIESLLGGSFKDNKDELQKKIYKMGFKDVITDKVYERKHEIFLGLKKDISYIELILHFLRLRNTVGAHSNRNPPKEKMILEDNVLEIQLFLNHLLYLVHQEINKKYENV